MLSKIIRPDSFNFDVPVASLMEVHSRGVDKDWMRKRAAMFDELIGGIKPEKNHTLIHVITTGAMETYGANSNCDAFNRAAREYTVPEPEGKAVILLDGGLDKYHKTYTEKGYVYKNHKDNKNPDNASGTIVREGINDDLNRGELIISVDNDKWHDEIENLAGGKPVYLSQGCGVKYDICSLCGHKRKRFGDECEHIRHHKLAITPEGYQVFVINDAPHFHDISGVVRPADKIAFALRKVASGDVITSDELARLEGYTAPTSFADNLYGKVYDKYNKLVKLAEIEKEILAVGTDPSADAFKEGSGFKDIDGRVAECIKRDPDRSLGIMHDDGMVLPPELFAELFGGTEGEECPPEVIEALKSRMPTLFSDMMDDENLDEVLKDGTYDGCPGLHGHIRPIIEKELADKSVDFGPVKRRVVIATLEGGGKSKKKSGKKESGKMDKKSELNKEAVDYLAREYGKYLLSFNRKCNNGFAERMSVLQKFV